MPLCNEILSIVILPVAYTKECSIQKRMTYSNASIHSAIETAKETILADMYMAVVKNEQLSRFTRYLGWLFAAMRASISYKADFLHSTNLFHY